MDGNAKKEVSVVSFCVNLKRPSPAETAKFRLAYFHVMSLIATKYTT